MNGYQTCANWLAETLTVSPKAVACMCHFAGSAVITHVIGSFQNTPKSFHVIRVLCPSLLQLLLRKIQLFLVAFLPASSRLPAGAA